MRERRCRVLRMETESIAMEVKCRVSSSCGTKDLHYAVSINGGIALVICLCYLVFFFQAEDGIRDYKVTGVQTCALPILSAIAVLLAVGTLQFRPAPQSSVGGAPSSTGSAQPSPSTAAGANSSPSPTPSQDRKSVV